MTAHLETIETTEPDGTVWRLPRHTVRVWPVAKNARSFGPILEITANEAAALAEILRGIYRHG